MNSTENETHKKLCLDLLHADSEDKVIEILKSCNLWGNENCWRYYGDDDNNFKTIGSQQARPEAALVEKLINAVDARLMDACLQSKIKPDDKEAPQSIKEARKRFYNNQTKTELAKGITLTITGSRPQQQGMPCITICDIGEGQTPKDVHDTFLSIDRKNKLRIPFVQGKFNMGGTGALMFCGKRKLQLLITKRNPKITSFSNLGDPTINQWSFTVVRRESPPEGPGQVRNPYFKYLAPINSNIMPKKGTLLTFESSEMLMMPDGNRPYSKPMEWGTCIKLYDYDMRGFKGNILRKGGLLSRLEVLLPEIALPVRLHECREEYGGKPGSYDTNLLGLQERLEASRSDNLEDGYPASLTLSVQGQPMYAKVYAFKGNNADTYRADQGVVFAVNGQTHGWFPKSFFGHSRVKMDRLAKALLIVVDCSEISVEARADLFKNSRDRLSGGELRKDIEEELEQQIANHPGLRELRERRRRDEVAEKLNDSKPLEDVIKSILKISPSLSKLFLLGQRLSRPFKKDLEGSTSDDGSIDHGNNVFAGKRYPTFFRFEKLKDNELLERSYEHGNRSCIIKFITDAENEYFTRDIDRGRYQVEVIEGSLEGQELTTSINLYNGIANWSVAIPEEDVAPGDKLTIQFSVIDDVVNETFTNIAKITIIPKRIRPPRPTPPIPPRPPIPDTGDGGKSNTEKDKDNNRKGNDDSKAGIKLPEIKKVYRNGWEERDFDEFSVCTIVDDGDGNGDGQESSYVFYINIDNIYLQTDIKQGKGDPALVEAKYIYGNVLIGLAIIHDEKRKFNKQIDETIKEEELPIPRKVENVSRALGPFLIPMIDYLGGLEDKDVVELASIGDED